MSILVRVCEKCDEVISCLDTKSGRVTKCEFCFNGCIIQPIKQNDKIPIGKCTKCK